MSYPKPSPLEAGYDQSLLQATPEVTRAERQGGYNVDLLNDDGRPRPQRSATQRTAASHSQSVRAASARESARHPSAFPGKEAYVPSLPVPITAAPTRSTNVPWFRTTRGIIALAIIVIVIVGAVVGGAVGGTVGHKNKGVSGQSTGTHQGQAPSSTSNSTSTSTSTPASAAAQGEVTLSPSVPLSSSAPVGSSHSTAGTR
ncbi:hypothetical protein M422DRAFT_261191 [Sphaerobolus stellatus SS14]|uniref:Uncharacterized protein n=1 Tax=Sphaerobolus stellatus (strain SS14) TaxID=990650 RepID=A0A0C9U130_SPHS4|nr:hypothetical protein M422DRAFT_261191 [Sphaerobolus stellatus SS14]